MSTPLTTEIVQQVLSVLTSGGQQYAYADPAAAAAQPFTPGVPTNWPLPLPVTIQEALDDLALRPSISTASNAGLLTNTGTLNVLAQSVGMINRGFILMIGQASGGLSAPGTMTLQLRVNGGPAPAGVVTDTVGAAPDAGFSLMVHSFFTVTRNSVVNFDMGISPTGGGTWNVPANFARLTILEF